MDLAICIAVKNRSNLVVYQEDPIETYKHIADKIQITPSDSHFPPTLNRDGTITLNLLPKLLMSLRMIKSGKDNWTIVIVDYESTDVNVGQIAHQILDGHIRYVIEKHEGQFNRDSGLQLAAEIARERGHDSLFFCDADMYFTSRYIFERAAEVLRQERVYSPICFSFTQPDHMKGYWNDTGYGMMFISIKKWQENVDFSEMRVRERASGYFHQWHPNSIVFKTLENPVKHYAGKAVVQKTENSSN
jgi:hypothetical protein